MKKPTKTTKKVEIDIETLLVAYKIGAISLEEIKHFIVLRSSLPTH
jgi:hypothetical protein